jgi:hypothetical protein
MARLASNTSGRDPSWFGVEVLLMFETTAIDQIDTAVLEWMRGGKREAKHAE